MERTFKQYVLDWWKEYVKNHTSDSKRLMETFIGEGETVEDYLDEGETPYDWLLAKDDANEIYTHFFGYSGKQLSFDDLPDTETFLAGLFRQAYTGEYDFIDELVEDMVYHAGNYDTPDGFFRDLSHGGCASGMIGMFIYNEDCKQFYIRHVDDLEEFVQDFEEKIGEPVINKDRLPHYTFVCWLCYEELAYNISGTIYPEIF